MYNFFGFLYAPPFFSPFRNLRKAAYEKAHIPLVSTAIFPNKPLRSTNQRFKRGKVLLFIAFLWSIWAQFKSF
jgi:hypothetical protein